MGDTLFERQGIPAAFVEHQPGNKCRDDIEPDRFGLGRRARRARRTIPIRSRQSATRRQATRRRSAAGACRSQLDATIASVSEETIGLAKIAVAEAKVLTTDLALLASSKLFGLAGPRSTLGVYNLA
jgi:hypothetical protein